MRRRSAFVGLGWLLVLGGCGGGSPGHGGSTGGNGGASLAGRGGASPGGAGGSTAGTGGAGGSASKRPWPDSTARTLILADQLPDGLTAAQQQFVVGHMVGTQKLTVAQSQPLRVLAPSFLVLHYHLAIWQSAPSVTLHRRRDELGERLPDGHDERELVLAQPGGGARGSRRRRQAPDEHR